MSNVYRFTGTPENWITAISKKSWGLNKDKEKFWLESLNPQDAIIFHSTSTSIYARGATSSIIGFGFVAKGKYKKEEYWWAREFMDEENIWPYVVPFKEIYLYSDVDGIDFNTPNFEKSESQIREEIEILTKGSIPISVLNRRKDEIDSDLPNFPVNGSASGVNEVYEELTLDLGVEKDIFTSSYIREDDILDKRISPNIDDRLEGFSREELLEMANKYKENQEHFKYSDSKARYRIESIRQKRIVARLEDFTCQVCGFKCEYRRKNGKTGYIIEIDHIENKSSYYGEELSNLWALCPNCHEKKTRGVISIDTEKAEVTENGKKIPIRDNHLFI